MSVDFVLQERDPWQRLCGERPEGNRSVVPAARAAVVGGQQQGLDLQLTLYTYCLHTVP